MALAVEKINGDSSFILTFSPSLPDEDSKDDTESDYTVLIDPWLIGHSSLWHPSFQISAHTTPCSYESLADLPKIPDMIIVSQNKPDHCHKATLCSMPKHWPTLIVAPESAAKRIMSWKHFNPSSIRILQRYRPNRPQAYVVEKIASNIKSRSSAEITISYVASKNDVTGLHNAIGITYRPSGQMNDSYFETATLSSDVLQTERKLPNIRTWRSSESLFAAFKSFNVSTQTLDDTKKLDATRFLNDAASSRQLRVPPRSPDSEMTLVPEEADSVWEVKTIDKALSVIYSPHGIQMSVLKPYVSEHLIKRAAYPPVALFHSMTTETNPWWMGGLVVAGAPNGSELAQKLQARHWFGAHDEIKESSGIATRWVKSKPYGQQQILKMLGNAEFSTATTIHTPAVGEKVVVQ